MTARISFIGAGNMAVSLVSGLIDDGYPPEKICVSCPTSEKLATLHARFGIRTTTSNVEAVNGAEVVVMAVKPHVLQTVAEELSAALLNQPVLVISVAAGVKLAKIEKWLNGGAAIVRCMPNTPALVRTGATALFASPMVDEAQKEVAESIMRSVGVTVWLDDEGLLDTVTALSGSGPAYFFMVIEAMQHAATQQGLSPKEAKLLTLQTALGAARMALESDLDASQLREQVTSKGGTTEAAIQVFEQGDLLALFSKAMDAAKHRAAELNQ